MLAIAPWGRYLSAPNHYTANSTPQEKSMFVTVRNCFDVQEALRAQMFLESRGISSFIPDENSAQIVPTHFFTAPGVRLQVTEDQAEAATRELNEFS